MLALMRNKPLVNKGLLECYGISALRSHLTILLSVKRQTKTSFFNRIVYLHLSHFLVM